MTAINPAKLKIQAVKLGELVDEPERLIPELHDLLDFYGTHIRQTSLTKTPLTLQSYQTPQPVLRALQIEFRERLTLDPAAGYELCDSLWQEPWVEFRSLAVEILNALPEKDPERILSRVRFWLDDCTSESIRRLIMMTGMRNLASENPARCLAFMDELTSAGTKADHQAALYGLELFALKDDFLNLPLLYKILARILVSDEKGLVKEISGLFRLLIARSEQETAYFLVQQLNQASQPRITRIARQLVSSFSPDNQPVIKNTLHKLSNK